MADKENCETDQKPNQKDKSKGTYRAGKRRKQKNFNRQANSKSLKGVSQVCKKISLSSLITGSGNVINVLTETRLKRGT